MQPGKQTAIIPGLTNGSTYTFKVTTLDYSNNESQGVVVQATPQSSNAEDPNSVMEKIGFVPLTGVSQPQYQARDRQSFDFNWKFNLGDITSSDPTTTTSPAIYVDYDDSQWRSLNLPHDWSIEGAYSANNSTGSAGGYLPTGIGWYRKTFDWSDFWQGKKVFIEFDGVYMNSDVWINGQHLDNRPYGYSSFEYDLTPYLHSGKNVISVKVDNSKAPSGRWYTGCGIYRHTWLTVTDNVHVAHWGTYVTTPTITTGSASVDIKTTVQNESSADQDMTLFSKIVDAAGKEVGSAESTQKLTAGGSSEIAQSVTITNPHLWSTDDPYLYYVKTSVKVNGTIVDDYSTEFGIRSINFDPNQGFSLNGVSMKIQGMCIHHDVGPLGAAVPDKELERRLRLMKQMGVNAIRTSHNPMAPEFYTLCNKLGLMVMDEAFDGWEKPKATYDYGLYFNDWWQKDLGDMVKRDRNDPCVILWSIGNEVPNNTVATATKLRDFVHQMDPTRLVTQAVLREDNVRAVSDVAGFNNGAQVASGALDTYHQAHPNQPLIATEFPHTYQTRGEYHTGPGQYQSKQALTPTELFPNIPNQYDSSYDLVNADMTNRDALQFLKDHPELSGFFKWTGFDYIGESNFGWPARFRGKGEFDVCGFAKDIYYLYKSQWTNEPVIHILPDWTHPGMEGQIIPVWVYTNCDSVELFLNGQSLGEKQMTNAMYLSWDVPYTPGELKAIGKKKMSDGGTQTFVDTVVTASDPAKINLYADNNALAADGRDISNIAFEVVDSNGNFVPNDNDLINFKVLGPVTNIGMDNGDPLDLTPNKLDYRKAFNGLGLGIFQSTQATGDIEVMAGGILSTTREQAQPKVAIDVERIALRGNLKARNLQLYYTTDGSEPGKSSQLYSGPFTIAQGAAVKAAVFDGDEKLMTLGYDKASLVQAIYDVQNLNAKDYAPSAWTAVQTALQKAISVSDNAEATQEMIDGAYKALQAAVNTTQRWITVQDSETTTTEGTPLNKFYYYSKNTPTSWKSDSIHTWDGPTRTAEDYATITFVGTKIELYCTSSTNEGYAAVSIKGGQEQMVDEYSTATGTGITGKLVYTSPDLTYGQHTLKVRCANLSSGNPDNRSINIDFVKIRQYDPNDQTAPGEVTGLTATPGDGQVTLNWTDPTDQDLTGIKITVDTATESAIIVQPGQQTALIPGLTNGALYTFKFTTLDASGNESTGSAIQAIPLANVIDKTALAAKITEAQGLTETDYTPETWALLQAALTAAVEVNNQAQVTQEEVSTALGNLQAVLGGLERSGVSEEGKPFSITTNAAGTLDRTGGIQATVNVTPVTGAGEHSGKEVVVFQLMKGTTPVSIVAVEKDILAVQEFTAFFNVMDPDNLAYTVKAFVFDTFNSELSVPRSLASPVILR